MSDSSAEQFTRLDKRRIWYRHRRDQLISLGVLPERKVGRPRLRDVEEALEFAKLKRMESQRNTARLIREGLARLASNAVNEL